MPKYSRPALYDNPGRQQPESVTSEIHSLLTTSLDSTVVFSTKFQSLLIETRFGPRMGADLDGGKKRMESRISRLSRWMQPSYLVSPSSVICKGLRSAAKRLTAIIVQDLAIRR